MKCAYCGNEGRMTREHIIPNGFIQSMDRKEQIIWSDAAPQKVIESDIVIKDVCSSCNNGPLSELDAYALRLCLDLNKKFAESCGKFNFKYNYNMLSRWLLKVCYNSARANKCLHDISLYKTTIEYILGQSPLPQLKIGVFAVFMEIPNSINCVYHLQENCEHKIDWFRIASFRIRELLIHDSCMRCVIVNSMAFIVMVYDEKLDIKDIVSIEKALYNHCACVKLNDLKKATLKKDKKFFTNSLLASATLHENFLKKNKNSYNDFLILTLTRKEIEILDFTQIRDILAFLHSKEKVLEYYQKLIISVDGYNGDKRELYQIVDTRKYLRAIVKNFPQIVWFLNISLELGLFRALLLSYLIDYNENQIDNEAFPYFITRCFDGVNKLLHEFAIDKSYNDKFTALFGEVVINMQN